MRKDGDHRPDDIVKEELLAQMRGDGYEPFIVFDDRKRVVDMWRRKDVERWANKLHKKYGSLLRNRLPYRP